jgi:hypothetical protein
MRKTDENQLNGQYAVEGTAGIAQGVFFSEMTGKVNGRDRCIEEAIDTKFERTIH